MIKHVLTITGITAFLTLCMVYPFLPGGYDSLARPLSTLVQAFSFFGLLLSAVGILWLLMPGRQHAFSAAALYLATFIFLLLAMAGLLSSGKILGISILLAWTVVFLRLRPALRQTRAAPTRSFVYMPVYLISIPVLLLVIQFILTKPVTRWSRNRVIENASEYIGHLEQYHARYGSYPVTVQAQWKDYYPDVAGFDKYHYMPLGSSYNLSFEQPRFLFDRIGTDEWVVYNPKDENRAYSHTAWFLLLTPEQLDRRQGWYSSGETEQAHWKYFLFD